MELLLDISQKLHGLAVAASEWEALLERAGPHTPQLAQLFGALANHPALIPRVAAFVQQELLQQPHEEGGAGAPEEAVAAVAEELMADAGTHGTPCATATPGPARAGAGDPEAGPRPAAHVPAVDPARGVAHVAPAVGQVLAEGRAGPSAPPPPPAEAAHSRPQPPPGADPSTQPLTHPHTLSPAGGDFEVLEDVLGGDGAGAEGGAGYQEAMEEGSSAHAGEEEVGDEDTGEEEGSDDEEDDALTTHYFYARRQAKGGASCAAALRCSVYVQLPHTRCDEPMQPYSMCGMSSHNP